MKSGTRVGIVALAGAVAALAPSIASAFCGFYVSGADAKLFNNATNVVLMREGTRTILSMQNNYQGPPENFAMVVPVPSILQKENVKTLPKAIFDKIDQLGSPRLVEYWEQDPCYQPPMATATALSAPPGAMRMSAEAAKGGAHGVKVEAQFEVGEYEVVILSAKDASGLDTWLRENGYKIPAGAEPYLRPYVQNGSKFFVAKVNAAKVKFVDGQAELSPLRFHYESDKFELPIRLGLINSQGTQDLIVNILANKQRYEVANYPNATIPTNIDVADGVREKFGAFYNTLFDKTVEVNPKAVVTEYAWQAGSCDPCPTPGLVATELATLGDDVVAATAPQGWRDYTLTRLHARYQKDALGDDLAFRVAEPIQGGREVNMGAGLEKGAKKSSVNNFQARYAIRHAWEGPITCEKPTRGRWGGPPAGKAGTTAPKAAAKLASAPRAGITLAALIDEDVPELALRMQRWPAPKPAATTKTKAAVSDDTPAPEAGAKRGCLGCAAAPRSEGAWAAAFGLLGLGLVVRSRTRRR